MSFLPGSLTPALLRSCHRKVISHSDGHSILDVEPAECFWGKTKRADYTEHQKSAGASLSLQSDVLCNRLWKFKVGFCFLQLLPTEPKAWWSSPALPVYRYRVGRNRLMVEHWYSVVPPLYRYITYPSSFWMSLTIFGISKSSFQRGRKRSLYWLGHLGAIYQRVLENIFIYLQKKHSNSYLYLTYFLPRFFRAFCVTT